MATTIITDTLRFTKDLQAAGMPIEQAEALADAFSEHAVDIVTKDHLDARLAKLELRLFTGQAFSTLAILAVIAKAHGWF